MELAHLDIERTDVSFSFRKQTQLIYKIKKCEMLILLKALTVLNVNFAANFQHDCHSAGFFNKDNTPNQF